MTKQDILDYFSDINQAYNDSSRLDSLSNMIDEMVLEKENKYDRHGDLISREDLKKAFEEVYPLSTNEMGGVVNKRIYDIIDNAPTVEGEIEILTKEAYSDLCLRASRERPHGEWEEPFKHKGKTYHKCTRCHISTQLMLTDNFCPNCGADMRKEKENEC